MSEFKDLREWFTAGAKAAGVDITDPKFADFINREEFAVNLAPSFINQFETLVFKLGKTNEGLKHHWEKEITKEASGKALGTILEMSERQARQYAKAQGYDLAPLDEILENTKGSHKDRWDQVFEYFNSAGLATGQKNAKNDRGDEALKAEIKRIEALAKQREADLEAVREQHENALKAKESEFANYKTRIKLRELVKSEVPFRKDLPNDALGLIIDGKIDSVFNKYNVINKNGEMLLYEKDDPTHVARDPETGQELKINSVLTSLFSEDYRQKQPEQGGNGGGNGQPGIRITPKTDPGAKRTAHMQEYAERFKKEVKGIK